MVMVREAAGLFDHPLKISVARRREVDGSWRVTLVERRGEVKIGEIAMDRDTARWLAGEILRRAG